MTEAFSTTYTVEPYNVVTIETITVYPEHGGIRISEACGIFVVGVAMCTCVVECYEAAFQSSPSAWAGGSYFQLVQPW